MSSVLKLKLLKSAMLIQRPLHELRLCNTMFDMITYDDDNLRKHGLTRDEADEILDTDLKMEEPMSDSERGNARVMLIGFNFSGQLLEIGVEVSPKSTFTSSMATKQRSNIDNYLSGDFMNKKKTNISESTRKALDAAKAEAHKKILKREFVQFRTDEPMMDLLLRVADQKRQPVGVMVREWVEQRLAQEIEKMPLPKIKLPSGNILDSTSPQISIEKAIIEHQNGVAKLGDQEYRTLMEWLLDHHLAMKYAKRRA